MHLMVGLPGSAIGSVGTIFCLIAIVLELRLSVREGSLS